MDAQETLLAEAAARLNVSDLRDLEEHGMLPEAAASGEWACSEKPGDSSGAPSENPGTSQKATSEKKSQKKEKRRRVEHTWPDVGTILEADYHGVHYEAEVLEAPRCKSGRGESARL